MCINLAVSFAKSMGYLGVLKYNAERKILLLKKIIYLDKKNLRISPDSPNTRDARCSRMDIRDTTIRNGGWLEPTSAMGHTYPKFNQAFG